MITHMRRWVIEEVAPAVPCTVTVTWPDDSITRCNIVEVRMGFQPMPVKRLQIVWTCSDRVSHEHRWKWTAWLCGRWQRISTPAAMMDRSE